MLEPVKLTVDPALKGRNRRQAAGAALYEIMSDLVFRTTSTDRTVFEAVVEAAATHGWRRVAVEDPVTGSLTYKRLLVGAARARPQARCRSPTRARRSASCCRTPTAPP